MPVNGSTPARAPPDSVRSTRPAAGSVPSGTAPPLDHSTPPVDPLYAVTPPGDANSTAPSAASASVPENGRPNGELSVRCVPVTRSMTRSAVTGAEPRYAAV